MSTLFIIVFIMSIFHFIYEGIFVPSIRLKLRFEAFALRDKLRRLKANNENDINDEEYFLINDSVNNTIRLIPYTTIGFLGRALQDIIKNPELRRTISAKLEIIKKSKINEVRQISAENNEIIRRAFMVNSFAFVVYLSPIVIPVIFLSVALTLIVKKIKNLFIYLLNIPFYPESEVEKITNLTPVPA